MAAFWDKIKSVAKGTDEKKDQEQKKDASEAVISKVPKDKKAPKDKSESRSKDVGVKAKEKKDPVLSKDKSKEKEPKKSKKKAKKRDMKPHEAQLVNRILVLPKISEAVMKQQSLGKYVFEVSKNSTKSEIACAVEMMYGVSVRKVNTLCYKPESHGFKGMSGMKRGYKKAIVSLKEGDSIELFKEPK